MSDMITMGGQWQIPNDTELYNGELHFDKEKRIVVLEIIIPASEQDPIPSFVHRGKIEYINGTLFNGSKVLLYDCIMGQGSQSVFSHTRQTVYASYALWGLSVDGREELVFRSAFVDFGDILNWYGLCRYENITEYKSETKEPSHTYQWRANDPIEVKLENGLNLSFLPRTQTYFGEIYGRDFSLEQTVLVNFEYSEEVPWERIVSDIRKIQYLISLGIGGKAEVGKMKYTHRKIFHDIPNWTGDPLFAEADVTFGTGEVTPTKKQMNYEFLFPFKEFLQLDHGVENWDKYYDKLKPILDLFFSLYGSVGTVETAFLSLTQALETYHARFISNKTSEYEKRVQQLVSKYENPRLQEQWQAFLLDEGQKKNKKLFLRSRLADLYYAEGELPLRSIHITPTDFIEKITDSRNYYTHYGEDKKAKAYTQAELPQINGYLMCLLQYHLMITIGFSPDYTKKRIAGKVGEIAWGV